MTDPNDEFEREPFGVKFHSPSTGNSISSKTSETLINTRHLEGSSECVYHTKIHVIYVRLINKKKIFIGHVL